MFHKSVLRDCIRVRGLHFVCQIQVYMFWFPTGKNFSIVPECVARVPVSLWGSGGWGCVRSTLRLRPQPSATVRNRSQPSAWGPYGRAYGKFCKRGHFWRFQTLRCFVSRGRRGTSWHSGVFRNVWKIVLCGRRNTSAAFSQKTRCRFLAGAALWRPPSSFCVASAALDVSHCVLYTPHSTLHTPHFTLNTLHFTFHIIPHFTLHFTLYTLHSTLYTPHSALRLPHSTLYTLHSTLHTLHSTLFGIPQPTVHWYGNRGKCRLIK